MVICYAPQNTNTLPSSYGGRQGPPQNNIFWGPLWRPQNWIALPSLLAPSSYISPFYFSEGSFMKIIFEAMSYRKSSYFLV